MQNRQSFLLPALTGACRQWMGKMAVTLALALSSLGAHAAEFGVSPMLIELTGAPDVSQDFHIQVLGKTSGNAKVSVYRLNQLPTGHMEFLPPEAGTEDMSGWITLEKNKLSIRKGETVVLNGSVKVPRKAAGTNVAAIMVEEDQPLKAKGITLNVRYAVVLSVNVGGTMTTRTITNFHDLSLEPQEERVFIKGLFKNGGKTDGQLNAELQLRDASNRLVLKTPLKTQSAWQRSDAASRVFPGSEVVVFGELPRTLPAGTYQAFVRNRFSDRAQPLVKTTVELPANLFAAPAAPAAAPVSTPTPTEPARTAAPAVAMQSSGEI
ncbi:MAG: hypothetical protein Q7T36_13880 [Fluviicoccus sp.]|uniref:hypothetical protein n=1 Tax=Fluviicoccus sp. TaxID=2003552 RepID=UPI0027241F82|nr:hypothetical protein [Fluviicoccus sp.]MDO8331550.1 hypothetical protein [Fluviicoccus sp.]